MKQRLRSVKFQEHFSQAQLFYNSLAPHEQQHVINALSFELNKVEEPEVIEKMIEKLNNVDYDLAKQVALNVGGTVPEKVARENHGKKSNYLSQAAFIPAKPTIKYVARILLN
jgi:catalase